jgi:phenylalanyl-tRNA synthetase beta chain
VGEESVYDIEITTNRIDMVSVIGIAREAAAILPRFGIKATFKDLAIKTPEKPTASLPIEIIDSDSLCDRLLAVVLDGIALGPSPQIIKDRLEKCGVRSLNNVIDITNYMMLEVGHPCHVFDYDRIKSKKLVLRKARKGERLITLDNKTCELTANDVVIDDGTGEIIDLPGIMGTKNSVVTPETKRVLFFIESNNPFTIRRTSMRLGLRSMAANINEKHPDPDTAYKTLLAGIAMYEKITRAKVSNEIIDIYPHKMEKTEVSVSASFINDRLGITLSETEMTGILTSLQFEVKKAGEKMLITPPSFRNHEISIPEDIVEEVARIYGYHNLPVHIMRGDIPMSEKPQDLPIESNIKHMLKYWGFTEVYNYSFISKSLIQKSGLSEGNHLHLSNPLTEEIEYMRISLIPSMLQNIENNQAFSDTLQLFELAKTYTPQPNDLPIEESHLTISTQLGFLHLKGIVESLFCELGIELFHQMPTDIWKFGHPKQSLALSPIINGKTLNISIALGCVHPNLSTNFQLKKTSYIADIPIGKLIPFCNKIKKYTPIPSYPPIKEDITFILSQTVGIGELIDVIKKTSKLIAGVDFVDQFKSSATFSVIYQDPAKNLSQEDILPARKAILEAVKKEFGVEIKKKPTE